MPWYQPNSPMLEQYALSKAIDPQASAFEKIAQVALNPVSTMLGAGAGYLADKNQERNMELQDHFSKNGIAYKSDMQGNIVPLDDRGLLSTLFGAGGFTGSSGSGGLLASLFGGGAPSAPQHYGGYVVDGSGRPINSGSGFLSYGSGPAMNDNSPSPGVFQAGEVGIDQ